MPLPFTPAAIEAATVATLASEPLTPSAVAGVTAQNGADPVKSLRQVQRERGADRGVREEDASSAVAAIHSTWWRLTMIVPTSWATVAPAS